MLSEVASKFFPGHDRTIFDDGTLAARVTSIRPDDLELAKLLSDLCETRLHVVVLFEWYQWYRSQGRLDPGGMFEASRQKHLLTRSIAEDLDKIAYSIELIHDMAPQAEGGLTSVPEENESSADPASEHPN